MAFCKLWSPYTLLVYQPLVKLRHYVVVFMSSQCLFDGGGRDVLALVSRVDTSGPQNLESAADCAQDWDALAADIAASYFTGDLLRWYEGLNTVTQESWVLLRATLLEKFVIEDDDSTDEKPDGIIGYLPSL
ncbi:hypothetical protein FRC00_009604 [Tulasnella sp. 408]|nr:hypothetical protein FRC00_009604 [Tulasnella sp. 408]